MEQTVQLGYIAALAAVVGSLSGVVFKLLVDRINELRTEGKAKDDIINGYRVLLDTIVTDQRKVLAAQDLALQTLTRTDKKLDQIKDKLQDILRLLARPER